MEYVREIIKLNIFAFHIRKTSFTKEEYINYIEKIPTQYHHKIVIHDYYDDLLKRFNIKGIHLTRKFLETRKKHPELHRQYTLSKSCHTVNELTHLDDYDYAFLSPIFDSISKPDYKQNKFNLRRMTEIIQRVAKPVFALGGITQENIKEAQKIGFSHFAVLGSVWQDDTPVKKVEKLLKELNH